MSPASPIHMDALDIADFLHGQQAGVLSIASDDASYAIPVSFAYEDTDSALYFRLGYGPDSQKRAFVDEADRATFVAYDHTDEGWKSVVARGRLEELSSSNLESSIVESVEHLDIPFFDLHEQPANELEFHIVRLDATELTGISER